MPLLHFVSGARAFCSCLPCSQRRQVLWHIKVSRRGQERLESSQMVTTARSCACGRAWKRLERDCIATPLPCVSSIAFVQRWECGALRTWCGVHLEPADVPGRVSGNCPDKTPPLCPVCAAARCVGEEEDGEEDGARVKAARGNVVRRRAPTSSPFLRV